MCVCVGMYVCVCVYIYIFFFLLFFFLSPGGSLRALVITGGAENIQSKQASHLVVEPYNGNGLMAEE